MKINSLNKRYVGTFGFGVMVYDLNTKNFKRDEHNPLPGGPGLVFDNQNNCYIVDFGMDSLRVFSANHSHLNSYLVGDGPVSMDIIDDSVNRITRKKIINPNKLTLYQNHPNPFNPVTNIQYYLPKKGKIQLRIFDIMGERVQSIILNTQSAGQHHMTFDGSNLASGIYYYQLKSGSDIQMRRMMLIK